MIPYQRLPGAHFADVIIDNAAAAYSTGDTVGTVKTIQVHTIANRGIHLVGALVKDTDEAIVADLDLHFWSNTPTLAADNAAYTFLDADMSAGYFIGKIAVATANYVNVSGLCDYAYKSADLKCALPGTAIYMSTALRTAGETWSIASSITVRLHYVLLY